MELLVKINKKLEQRRAILNTIIQNVGIQNNLSSTYKCNFLGADNKQ